MQGYLCMRTCLNQWTVFIPCGRQQSHGTLPMYPFGRLTPRQPVAWMASNGISAVPPSGGGDKHYEISSEIGRGAYGTVYKARDRRNEGKYVALKEISIQTNSEEGVPASTIREIGLLKQLEKYNHPNVVRLEDFQHWSYICVCIWLSNEMECKTENCLLLYNAILCWKCQGSNLCQIAPLAPLASSTLMSTLTPPWDFGGTMRRWGRGLVFAITNCSLHGCPRASIRACSSPRFLSLFVGCLTSVRDTELIAIWSWCWSLNTWIRTSRSSLKASPPLALDQIEYG